MADQAVVWTRGDIENLVKGILSIGFGVTTVVLKTIDTEDADPSYEQLNYAIDAIAGGAILNGLVDLQRALITNERWGAWSDAVGRAWTSCWGGNNAAVVAPAIALPEPPPPDPDPVPEVVIHADPDEIV